jgi:hypothetical protein
MAKNVDTTQMTGRERLNALLELVPRDSSACTASGALLAIMLEFEEGASVGKSPKPANSVAAPVLLTVVDPVATVAAVLELDTTVPALVVDEVVHCPILETLIP